MFTEELKTDKIEVLEDGQLQVREAAIVYKDGVEISRTFRRYVLDPGRDTEKLADKDARVQAVANAIWTEDVVAARASKRSVQS
jgi:hypothetical protein